MVLYIIKGFHYSTFLPRIYKPGVTKTIKVKFDKSCAYNIQESSCVNKLWGFSVGLFGVHENSYRFGWTYENGKIIIWTYSYINGRLYKNRLTECEFDKEYECNISIHDKVVFNFNGVVREAKLFKSNWLLELGFYFGGKTRSPHTMHISFERIK